jgi:hypothetical protein
MQVMGMRKSVVWLVWFMTSAFTMLVLCLLLTLLLSMGGILPLSNPFLIFALLASYIFGILGFWSVGYSS